MVTACVLAPVGQDACSDAEARVYTRIETFSMPTRCPRCGNRWVIPTFRADLLDLWDCTWPGCGRSFMGSD